MDGSWRSFWRTIHDFVNPDLPGKIAALDDDKLVRLRDSIYRNPRGLKGVHIRMVTSECVRRGL